MRIFGQKKESPPVKWNIPADHPRYLSLLQREKILEGAERKVVTGAGIVAQGRGEAFDYLIGETTRDFARKAVWAACQAFRTARKPVISVNGNVAALCPEELVRLSVLTKAPLEINLFYREPGREEAVLEALQKAGACDVLGTEDRYRTQIPELTSDRRFVDERGIAAADLVFVPLEDGDRTEALVRLGKKVVTVDLNPLSRTARTATITIVDNIIRALPLLCELYEKADAGDGAIPYDNKAVLRESVRYISEYLTNQAEQWIS